jgi:hypothetical protein
MRRRHTTEIVAMAVFVVASMVMPALAWANYIATGSAHGTNTFRTSVLVTPVTPTCVGLAIASTTVSLSWPGNSSADILSYAIDQSASINGTYTSFVADTASTATSYGPFTIANPATFYKVRGLHRSWTTPSSVAVKVVPGILNILFPSCQ